MYFVEVHWTPVDMWQMHWELGFPNLFNVLPLKLFRHIIELSQWSSLKNIIDRDN